jgi:hypothetical protein
MFSRLAGLLRHSVVRIIVTIQHDPYGEHYLYECVMSSTSHKKERAFELLEGGLDLCGFDEESEKSRKIRSLIVEKIFENPENLLQIEDAN